MPVYFLWKVDELSKHHWQQQKQVQELFLMWFTNSVSFNIPFQNQIQHIIAAEVSET